MKITVVHRETICGICTRKICAGDGRDPRAARIGVCTPCEQSLKAEAGIADFAVARELAPPFTVNAHGEPRPAKISATEKARSLDASSGTAPHPSAMRRTDDHQFGEDRGGLHPRTSR